VSATAWSPQQFAEFAAVVAAATTEAGAARVSVERAAETLGADAAAIVGGGEIIASVGFAAGGALAEKLARVTPGSTGSRLEVPGVGVRHTAAAGLANPRSATLVVTRTEPFTRVEAALLHGMASVASTAMGIQRAMDAERIARHELELLAREQAALRRVATLVAEATSPDEVFSAVAEEVAQLSDSDIARVLRFEPGDKAVVVGAWGLTDTALAIGTRHDVAGEGVVVSVLSTGQPAQNARFAGPPGSVANGFAGLGAKVGSGNPIVVDGRLWGVVVAARTRSEPLSPETERRIPPFTELLATAIANAQARVELGGVADEQAALRRVATLIARGEPPMAAFTAVAREVTRLFDVDATAVTRYDHAGGITTVGSWNVRGDPVPSGTWVPLGGRNVSTLVFETRKPVRVDSYEPDDASVLSEVARGRGMLCAVGAPIDVEGGLWGALQIATARPGGLPARTEERLAVFAELAAAAIGNAQAREELQAIAADQAALRQVATLVAEGAPPPAAFAAVAEEVGRLLDADYAFIARYEPDALSLLATWSSSGDPAPVTGKRPYADDSSLSMAVRETGAPARVDWYADDAGPVPPEVVSAGLRSAVAVPITVAGRVWGLIGIATKSERQAPPGTESRLVAFTELVATAIANAQSQAELTASRARIVANADEIRRRIERDLHDGAQQRLVALALQLRTAQTMVPPAHAGIAEELDKAAAGLTNALDELREYARGIHPAILTERGLGAALRTLARRAAVPVELDLQIDRRLPESVEAAAYFMVLEAVTDAVKHANAAVVAVGARTTEDVLRLSIEHDGHGAADFWRGSRLMLKDRVDALGGTIEVQIGASGGTSIRVELPYVTQSLLSS
jgi:signal transduction histidine kinase